MREYAAVHGLFVEFRRLPGSVETGDKQPVTPRGDIIYYGRRLPPPRGNSDRGGNWLQDNQGWRSHGRRVPVPAPLLDLPAGILAASVDDNSCGIYWQEAGEQEEVEQIRQVLEGWSGELCS